MVRIYSVPIINNLGLLNINRKLGLTRIHPEALTYGTVKSSYQKFIISYRATLFNLQYDHS